MNSNGNQMFSTPVFVVVFLHYETSDAFHEEDL